jgi:hypothetical protein
MCMYVKKRVKKRQSLLDRYKIRGLLVFCVCLFLLAVSIVDLGRNTRGLKINVDPAANRSRVLAEEKTPPQKERLLFPYSVIPGGVRSRGELATKIIQDRVVAVHYADFNIGDARIIPAPETRYAHVSYRLRNKIYWTSKKVKIPKGESLITDGRCDARARCGNRISASPLGPMSGEEPMLESLDIPEMVLAGPRFSPDDFEQRIDLPLMGPPPRIEPIHEPIPTFGVNSAERNPWNWPYNYRAFVIVRPNPVPEIGSFGLLLLGVLALVVFRFFSYRKSE